MEHPTSALYEVGLGDLGLHCRDFRWASCEEMPSTAGGDGASPGGLFSYADKASSTLPSGIDDGQNYCKDPCSKPSQLTRIGPSLRHASFSLASVPPFTPLPPTPALPALCTGRSVFLEQSPTPYVSGIPTPLSGLKLPIPPRGDLPASQH